ncbi:MAG: AAA family ATPase [Candidatus Lokiarchaeota archaeon]|nr:AAA family ATPase [Candidatus Lokiarchaeota archaeon]
MDKNNFNKQVLTRYVQTQCERQLFLDLGRNKPYLWFDPIVELEKPKRKYRGSENLEKLGKKYEQKVYSKITSLTNVKCEISQNSSVTESFLDEKEFLSYHSMLSSSQDDFLVLLEHEFEIPESFFRDLFELKHPNDRVPVDYARQRPDILVIQKIKGKNARKTKELLPEGTVRSIPEIELNNRYGINVIDIKNIRKEKIGKKQFTEIFYYMWTLSYYLRHKRLTDKFFINIDNNAIFPYNTDDKLMIKNIQDIHELSIGIHFNESHRIFIETINEIKKLWMKTPCNISNIPVNIQSNCGYCFFIEDCKKFLGVDGSTSPEDWSLMLLPYTSTSIAQQLMEKGMKTIGDVNNNLKSIQIGDTPEPLYSEKPLLDLKARAIINDDIIPPQMGQVHAYLIPKFTSIALNIAIETDPANQRVYGVGLYLYISISPNSAYSLMFDNWWQVWDEALKAHKTAKEIHEMLNAFLFRKIPLEYVELFLNYLITLKKFLIFPKGEPRKNGTGVRKRTIVIYQFASVNEGDTDESEAKFSKHVINYLSTIFDMCNIIENYVVVEAFEPGKFFGPTTSFYYWSSRQLNNFQDMLERTLEYIIDDPKTANSLNSILSLFKPSDSEVTHPYQHKKLFDIQKFSETIFGIPGIISYTWHEIAKRLLDKKVNSMYWIPHFNYMDFNNWYDYLLEEDPTKNKELKKKLKQQLMFKVRTINDLRSYFQREGGSFVSKHSRVITDKKLKSVFLDSHYHPIAQVWYLFSKYLGAMDETEAEGFRTIYPEYSIAKLAAGKVTNLQMLDFDKKVSFQFFLVNLSSNMKIDEGDRVYLIPDNKRGMRSGNNMEKCKIIIKKLTWSNENNGYIVESELTRGKFFRKYIHNVNDTAWYVYPTSVDSWSNKLYREDGLLQRHSFGTSWLGSRRSYLWKVRSNPKLRWPSSWVFNSPSIYLFAPELLFQLIDVKKNNLKRPLITPILPPPDRSQSRAINNSLGQFISAIQGPPGTGKSQTIAALIDEYIERNKQKCIKNRILVTAFSYAAIRVIINKVRQSNDKSGNPTSSAKTQLIFLRSEHQKPVDKKAGCRDVDDLLRKGYSWKLNGQSRTVTATRPLEESLEEDFILFANAHQLYHLKERVRSDFYFDLIIVDEASQLQVDYFMSSLQFVRNVKLELRKPSITYKPNKLIEDASMINRLEIDRNQEIAKLTKIIIVGDYNQLPPVQPLNPPKNLEKVLQSLFGYYVQAHSIPSRQLQVNYRSNKAIVKFTSMLGVYKKLKAAPLNASLKLGGNLNNIKTTWIKDVLDPNKIVGALVHDNKYEIGVSTLEAEMVSELVIGYFKMSELKTKQDEQNFWKEKIGVVAPHNAQGRLIIRKIYTKMIDSIDKKTLLEPALLMKLLKNTVYSVEKFQGSDREFIIASIGLSDKDQLNAEVEFIYNLNRFNVLTSRAKCKVILISSDMFLNNIPSDRKVMEEAAQIRKYAYNYCNTEKKLTIIDDKDQEKEIRFRYRQ